MATWNASKPAVGNQISADIPDIEENFLELHDVITAITNGTLGTTTAANFKVDVLADGADCGDTPVITTGINDGSQDIDFPTNNMSACKFLTGNSNTIAWLYLNTAPPGWKTLSTGADKNLAIAGGSGAYNVNGGNIAGTSFDDLEAHTHTGPSHNHQWYEKTGTNRLFDSSGNATAGNTYSLSNYPIHCQESDGSGLNKDAYTNNAGTGNTGASSTTEARVTAAVGRLFQFDTA